MLQIRRLSITHNRDLRTIVKDFSMTLQPGDKAAVIGEEGNGKSTLLKLICDESLVAGYAEWTGEIIRGKNRLGYLPQELPWQDLQKRVRDYWKQCSALNPAEEAALLEQWNLPASMPDWEQSMELLSGGERVKLQLACILSGQPDVLLLDEPSNDLDLGTLQWLERFISTCPQTVLFVSHDETLIRNTANVIVHLEALRRKMAPRATVARLPYDLYVEGRQARFRHQAQVSRQEHAEFQRQMDRFLRIRNKVEHQQSTISRQDPHGGQLLKKKMHALQSTGRRLEKEKEKLTQMPELEEAIFLRFPQTAVVPNGKKVLEFQLESLTAGGRRLARDLRLTVTGPEKIGIIGPNGCGKTTLLRLLARELLPRTDIRAAYMPQNYSESLDQHASPVEFLNSSGSRAEATHIRNYLGSLRFTTLEMERPISELSGGQKAKVFFLQMILTESNVLLLDEPTRNFSPLSGPVIREILSSFGGAILSVSHDRLYLEEVCQTIYTLTPEGLERLWSRKA